MTGAAVAAMKTPAAVNQRQTLTVHQVCKYTSLLIFKFDTVCPNQKETRFLIEIFSMQDVI